MRQIQYFHPAIESESEYCLNRKAGYCPYNGNGQLQSNLPAIVVPIFQGLKIDLDDLRRNIPRKSVKEHNVASFFRPSK